MKNHFDFGSPSVTNAGIMSTTKSQFNPPAQTPAPRAPTLFNNVATLKHRSVNVMDGGPAAKPGGAFYASNTSTSYKWVQPTFV